jgi:hypothetical protein
MAVMPAEAQSTDGVDEDCAFSDLLDHGLTGTVGSGPGPPLRGLVVAVVMRGSRRIRPRSAVPVQAPTPAPEFTGAFALLFNISDFSRYPKML